jgi:2-keto-4-pentenoate hydratase
MTGPRESILQQTANLLLDARRTGNTLAELPAHLVPDGIAEVCFVQDLVAAAFGPVGGYKIGAPSPEATPAFAPMPAAWIAPGGSRLATARYRGVEAEIAFLVGKDLPPSTTPYTRDEVLAAMASCHPAIEVLESAFTDPVLSTPGAQSDLQTHGGFVYGPAFEGWRSIDFSKENVVLSIDGVVRVERTGSNTSGDLLRLLPYLANEGAARTGGLRAGQWITTGSWTGNTLATAGSTVEACFSSAGRVQMFFA